MKKNFAVKVSLLSLLLCISLVMCLINSKTKAKQYVENGVDIQNDYGIRYYEPYKGTIKQVKHNKKYFNAYTVNSSGRKGTNQPEIKVDLADYGINSQSLYHGAYKTIVIVFQMTIGEIEDGYQEIYVNNTSSNEEDMVKPITNFEHGVKTKDMNFRRYEFYAELPADLFASTEFTIGFSAHGWFSNDWLVGNIGVQICTSQEYRKKDQLLYITNAAVGDLWEH